MNKVNYGSNLLMVIWFITGVAVLLMSCHVVYDALQTGREIEGIIASTGLFIIGTFMLTMGNYERKLPKKKTMRIDKE